MQADSHEVSRPKVLGRFASAGGDAPAPLG
jgi:hypothetical protein